MSDTDQTAYLFQCGDERIFAISPDKAGKNIPRSSCEVGWQRRQTLVLDGRQSIPDAISLVTVVRSIATKGFYIWRAG